MKWLHLLQISALLITASLAEDEGKMGQGHKWACLACRLVDPTIYIMLKTYEIKLGFKTYKIKLGFSFALKLLI